MEYIIQINGTDYERGLVDATVTYAEISPISSVYVTYDFPMQSMEIEGVGTNGEAVTSATFVEAPDIVGVRLKDGTLLTGIINGGAMGYPDKDKDVYRVSYEFSRVIDTNEIDALLFMRSAPACTVITVTKGCDHTLFCLPF